MFTDAMELHYIDMKAFAKAVNETGGIRVGDTQEIMFAKWLLGRAGHGLVPVGAAGRLTRPSNINFDMIHMIDALLDFIGGMF